MRFLLLLFFSATVMAQSIPFQRDHKFWDRQNLAALSTSAALHVGDAWTTCRVLHNGGYELWMPVKTCHEISIWTGGSFAADAAIGYLLHRRRHHRMERVLLWTNGLPNAVGLTLSAVNMRRK